MKKLFGIWTVLVALTVSAVAAYYSIVGLTAIFAAAVIPIVIMGVVLEVAKVTTAVWLHAFWDRARFLMKLYLTTATVVLMVITSMGIFGFLSKAHIEQAANSSGIVAQLERIDDDIVRQESVIERAEIRIDGFDERTDSADAGTQDKIEDQERLIASIERRLERDIQTQNNIIQQEQGILVPLQGELARLEERRTQLQQAQQSGDVQAQQALVGATTDGVLGPDTRRRIAEFQTNLDTRRAQVLNELERLQSTDNAAVQQARSEIQRLQTAANNEIQRAQDALNTFRNQLINISTVDNTEAIEEQEQITESARDEIDKLLERKYTLESELRILEVEVGPVRYVAELIYSETDTDSLEEAVRWVIILLVAVFDPLAIVLVLSGISVIRWADEENEQVEKPALDESKLEPLLQPIADEEEADTIPVNEETPPTTEPDNTASGFTGNDVKHSNRHEGVVTVAGRSVRIKTSKEDN